MENLVVTSVRLPAHLSKRLKKISHLLSLQRGEEFKPSILIRLSIEEYLQKLGVSE